MLDERRATNGFLVTTSYFGKRSHEFAARNGRIQLIEGNEFGGLLQEHLGLDVLLGLDRVPPNWKRRELAP